MSLGKLLKMLVEPDFDSVTSPHQIDPYPLPPGFRLEHLGGW